MKSKEGTFPFIFEVWTWQRQHFAPTSSQKRYVPASSFSWGPIAFSFKMCSTTTSNEGFSLSSPCQDRWRASLDPPPPLPPKLGRLLQGSLKLILKKVMHNSSTKAKSLFACEFTTKIVITFFSSHSVSLLWMVVCLMLSSFLCRLAWLYLGSQTKLVYFKRCHSTIRMRLSTFVFWWIRCPLHEFKGEVHILVYERIVQDISTFGWRK